MSRIQKVLLKMRNESTSDLVPFSKSLLKQRKSMQTFMKKFSKAYPDLEGDPESGHPGFSSFDTAIKNDQKILKKLFSNPKQLITDIEQAINDKDQVALIAIGNLDKDNFFSKSNLDSLVADKIITKDQASTLGKLSIEVQKQF